MVAAAFAAATSLQRVWYVGVKPHVPRYVAIVAGVTAVAALLYLFAIFLTTDLDHEIVHDHSSEDMPLAYKLSGSWAGQEGSMVLWVALVLGLWMVEEVRWWRREAAGLTPREEPEVPKEPRGRKGRKRGGKRTLTAKQRERRAAPPEGWLSLDLVRAVVMLVAFLLLVVTLALDPFAQRTTVFPEGGEGLNPVLRTPLMAVHPPIVFVAYALLTFVFAAAVAYTVRRDELWVEIARPWARLAWFTLTLGIGIGAMWAYVTLGWGGYWAWDPVETSSFVPWVALTALLHALHSHGRRGDYQHLAPVLAGMALFLVFFATFVTRSGVWSSVHAYAGAASGNATERLSTALEASASLRWIWYGMWSVLIVTLAGGGYRYWRAREDAGELPDIAEGERTWEWLARPRVSMLATVFLLSTAMVLTLFMLLISVDGTVSPGQYHARVGTFAIPLMAFLVICMAVRVLPRRQAAALAGASILTGAIVTLLNPGDVDPPVAWFGAVIGAFGVVAVLARAAVLVRGPRASRRRLLRRAGSILVHLGLAMVFMAYSLSNVPALPESIGLSAAEDVPVDHEEYSVVIVDREWTRDTGVSQRGEDWDDFEGRLRLYREGSLVSSEDVKVVSSWQFREYGTLSYEDPADGLRKRMDGEVVVTDLRGGSLLIKFQSLRDTERSVVVDIFDPKNAIEPWPALYQDAEILEGQVVSLETATGSTTGFLVSVGGEGGNVTLRRFDGGLVTVDGSRLDRVKRRTYSGLERTDVHIHRAPLKDVYVTVVSATPTEDGSWEATVIVREVPAMTVLWTGMGLMAIGILLRPLERYGERHMGGEEDGGEEPEDGDGAGAMAGSEEEESDEDES
jgi:cytochrome c-type biogenesis protein CcmF